VTDPFRIFLAHLVREADGGCIGIFLRVTATPSGNTALLAAITQSLAACVNRFLVCLPISRRAPANSSTGPPMQPTSAIELIIFLR